MQLAHHKVDLSLMLLLLLMMMSLLRCWWWCCCRCWWWCCCCCGGWWCCYWWYCSWWCIHRDPRGRILAPTINVLMARVADIDDASRNGTVGQERRGRLPARHTRAYVRFQVLLFCCFSCSYIFIIFIKNHSKHQSITPGCSFSKI